MPNKNANESRDHSNQRDVTQSVQVITSSILDQVCNSTIHVLSSQFPGFGGVKGGLLASSELKLRLT